MVNIERILVEMDYLANEMTQKHDEYVQKIQQLPPPWAIMQKVDIKVHLKRLQGDLDKWKNYIKIIESEENFDFDDVLYEKLLQFKRKHKKLIDGITMNILEGNQFLILTLESQSPDANVTSNTYIPIPLTCIPSLNVNQLNGKPETKHPLITVEKQQLLSHGESSKTTASKDKKQLCSSTGDVICQATNTANTTFISPGKQQGCLLTKQVKVMNPNTKETVDATVLFDPGSQRSFVSDKLIRQLKLPRTAEEQLHIEGIGAKATYYATSQVKLRVKTTDNYEDIQANSIKKIADTVPVLNFDEIDPTRFTVTNHPPDILLGMNYFFTFITSFERKNDMAIVYSKIGPMLSGNVLPPQSNTISSLAIEQKKLCCDSPNLFAMGKQDEQKFVTDKQKYEKIKKSTLAKTEHGIYYPHSSTRFSRSTKNLIETKDTIPNVGRGRTFYNTAFYAKRKRTNTVSFPHQQKLMFALQTTLTSQQLADIKIEHCHGQRSSQPISPQTNNVKPYFHQTRRETKTIKNTLKIQKVECQLKCFPSSRPSSSAGGEGLADQEQIMRTFWRKTIAKKLVDSSIQKEYTDNYQMKEAIHNSRHHQRSVDLDSKD